MELKDLEQLVEKMRSLGVTEYDDGSVKIKIGAPAVKSDEKSEQEQQRSRDKRERQMLELRRRMMIAASPRIGPPNEPIR